MKFHNSFWNMKVIVIFSIKQNLSDAGLITELIKNRTFWKAAGIRALSTLLVALDFHITMQGYQWAKQD